MGPQDELAQLVEHRGDFHRLRLWSLGLVGGPEGAGAQRVVLVVQYPAPEGRVGQERRQPQQVGARRARQGQQCCVEDVGGADAPVFVEQCCQRSQQAVGGHWCQAGWPGQRIQPHRSRIGRVDHHHVLVAALRDAG